MVYLKNGKKLRPKKVFQKLQKNLNSKGTTQHGFVNAFSLQDKRISVDSNSDKTQFTLTINDCTSDDAGTYTLQATSGGGQAEKCDSRLELLSVFECVAPFLVLQGGRS